MEKFERIDRKVVYEGAILDFCKDTIVTPKNNTVYWDFLNHKGAAAIIPVLEDGRIVMARQWRNAIDKFSLEIPAGGLDSVDEPTRECAIRELEEEAGYVAQEVEFLQTIVPAIAYSSEKIDVYVAHGLTKTECNFDPDEDIELEFYTIDQLMEMIINNEINDSKTVASLLTYNYKYNK